MPAHEAREAIRSWMFDLALPHWASQGLDREHGGYVEQLTLDGRDAGVSFKRTRVAGRQVYVFSHAALMGWTAGNELAAHGVNYLTERAWQGSDKGFARMLTRRGDVLDPTPDLYDNAFVLLGFAWRHKAMKDAVSRDWMHRTLDYVEAHMRHPGGEGFRDSLPSEGRRRQNPHMHFTEACLAAYDATGDSRFSEVARGLVTLFSQRFFDKATSTLGENFDEAWSRTKGENGNIVEPGHHLEWTWILNEARKSLSLDTANEMRALVRFAERHGVDPASGATYNSVSEDGSPIDRGSRTWPNAERLKAAVALWELDGSDPWPVITPTCKLLMQRYLGNVQPGLWRDALDPNGREVGTAVRASTFYHLFLAFSEVMRISEGTRNGRT